MTNCSFHHWPVDNILQNRGLTALGKMWQEYVNSHGANFHRQIFFSIILHQPPPPPPPPPPPSNYATCNLTFNQGMKPQLTASTCITKINIPCSYMYMYLFETDLFFQTQDFIEISSTSWPTEKMEEHFCKH